MNAASKDKLGEAPAAPNLVQDALREKHRRSRGGTREDAPASDPASDPEGEHRGGREPERGPEREPVRAPSPAPERERTRKGEREGAPESPGVAAEGHAAPLEGSGPTEAPRGAPGGPQGAQGVTEGEAGAEMSGTMAVLWELDQATRSYLGGLKKIAPRKTRLAKAVADYLEAGGAAADIRSRFAAIGIPARDIPTEIQEALRRR